ncbi:copper resistance protein CopC [Micromonospora sp. DR5-3]|uniref:copper resistance protein CopC n=1 Tax=unclassified Micromonospora TaxID=2617518 RepID=UPI0011D2FB3E|nr:MULTISPECIES: copper resistance protein CopC [unclassified Micromonospora]MCW3818935.1 copper resistance protein CopC [Micromonospora sp. DR5-3]TYC21481.1 copper resistance protein CopC [Micromonospora sp. MP36]
MLRLLRIVLLPLVVGSVLLLAPAPAAAATVSNPADGAALAAAPRQVTLTFTREPVAEASQVSVLSGDGRPVSESAQPVRAGLSLTQPVGIARAGDFTIVYSVKFADGGHEQGTRRFRVLTDPAPGGTDAHAGHTAHDVDPVSATLLVVDGLVVLVVVFLLILRRPGADPVAWRLPSAERKSDDRTA